MIVLLYIANLTFDQLTLEVLEDRVFQPILERKAYAVAKRLKSDLNQIFKFARKRKLITYNTYTLEISGDSMRKIGSFNEIATL